MWRTELELFEGEASFLAYRAIGSVVDNFFQQPGTYEDANILRGEFGMTTATPRASG